MKSKKNKYGWYLFLLLSTFYFSCHQEILIDPAIDNSKLITYFGGHIITMDGSKFEEVEAVVIEGDSILFVGSTKDAKRVYGRTAMVDLDGKTMLPGFIEPHVHPSIAVTVLPNEIIGPYDWDLPGGIKKGAKSEKEFRERLTNALAKRAKADEVFIVWGYHQMWHGELSRTILNEIAGDQPVGIIHRSFHEFFVNDAALKIMNIEEKEFKDQPQVDWGKGHFYEAGWLAVVPKIAGALFVPSKLQKGMAMMNTIIQKNGITTIAEPGFPSSNFMLEYGMYKSSMDIEPPYDLYLIPNGTRLYHVHGGNEGAKEFIEKLPNYNSTQLTFLPKQVKLFADGAMYSQLMQMKDGYEDDHEGQWMTGLDVLKKQVEFYWNNNYKIHVHANGDLGIEELINMVGPLRNEKNFEHRFTLHHMAYFSPDQANKMGELKMEASVNPYYLWALSDKYAEEGLGVERATHLVRTKSLLENDIPVSFHSDFSMAPLSPLTLAWVAVNRVTSGGKKVSQHERISVYEGLRSITIDAARTLNLESEIGSIAVGKRANFVILEEHPLKIDPIELKDIKIYSTIYRGQEFKAPTNDVP